MDQPWEVAGPFLGLRPAESSPLPLHCSLAEMGGELGDSLGALGHPRGPQAGWERP